MQRKPQASLLPGLLTDCGQRSFQKACARNQERAPISSPVVIFLSSHGVVEFTVQTLKWDSEEGKTASPCNPHFIHWKTVPRAVVHTSAVKKTPVFLRYGLKTMYSVLRLQCRGVIFLKK